MKSDTYTLKSNRLFPFQFQLVGWTFLLSGMVAIVFLPILAFFLLLVALLILIAYRGITFNRNARSYRIFHSFLCFKSGKKASYENIDSLYIHTSRMSQRVNTMITTGITTSTTEYDAYLKLDGAQRIYLMSHKNKARLLDKLSPLADYFGMKVREGKARQ